MSGTHPTRSLFGEPLGFVHGYYVGVKYWDNHVRFTKVLCAFEWLINHLENVGCQRMAQGTLQDMSKHDQLLVPQLAPMLTVGAAESYQKYKKGNMSNTAMEINSCIGQDAQRVEDGKTTSEEKLYLFQLVQDSVCSYVERYLELLFLLTLEGHAVQHVLRTACQNGISFNIWAPLKDNPKYIVSSSGYVSNIKSFPKHLKPAGHPYQVCQIYHATCRQKKVLLVHRVVLDAFNMYQGKFQESDHIDRNTRNNSLTNLRSADRYLQMQNTSPRKKQIRLNASPSLTSCMIINKIDTQSGQVVARYGNLLQFAYANNIKLQNAQDVIIRGTSRSDEYTVEYGIDKDSLVTYYQQQYDIPMFPRYQINRAGVVFNSKSGHVLTPYMNQQYLVYTLLLDQGRTTVQRKFFKSRLLAQVFIPNPNNLPHVHHKNGNKLDNRLENLQWVTSSQNSKYWSSSAKRVLQTSIQVSCEACKQYKVVFRNIKVASKHSFVGYSRSLIQQKLAAVIPDKYGYLWQKPDPQDIQNLYDGEQYLDMVKVSSHSDLCPNSTAQRQAGTIKQRGLYYYRPSMEFNGGVWQSCIFCKSRLAIFLSIAEVQRFERIQLRRLGQDVSEKGIQKSGYIWTQASEMEARQLLIDKQLVHGKRTIQTSFCCDQAQERDMNTQFWSKHNVLYNRAVSKVCISCMGLIEMYKNQIVAAKLNNTSGSTICRAIISGRAFLKGKYLFIKAEPQDAKKNLIASGGSIREHSLTVPITCKCKHNSKVYSEKF